MPTGKGAAILLLMLGLTGCRYDEPEDVVRAKLAQLNRKELFTDHASVLFAQQELNLARAKAASLPQGSPDTAAEQAAVLHQRLAALQLQLAVANIESEEDLEKFKSLSEQILAAQPHEGTR